MQAAAPSSAKPKAGPKSKTQQPSAAAAVAAESTPSGPRSAKRNSSYMVDSDSDADDDPLTGGGSAKKKDKKANDSADDDYQPGLDINLKFFATLEWFFFTKFTQKKFVIGESKIDLLKILFCKLLKFEKDYLSKPGMKYPSQYVSKSRLSSRAS